MELNSQLESDLKDTIEFGEISMGQVTGAVDVEMGGSLLKEKLAFKALSLSIMCGECLTAHL